MFSTPTPTSVSTSPSWILLGTEPWRAANEYVSHRFQKAIDRPRPRGDGHPVVVFPGLATNGKSVAPLVEHCESLGYQAMDWGRGFNTGPDADIDRWLHELAADVRRLVGAMHSGSGSVAPTLIGWSLGGIYARELAKLPGMKVRQVITIGTPFNGHATQTNAGWLYKLLNGQSPDLTPGLRQRLQRPPAVRTTSIYSRSDGVVAWQACCHDGLHDHVQDVEVQSSHLGMGWNQAVLHAVRDCLSWPMRI